MGGRPFESGSLPKRRRVMVYTVVEWIASIPAWLGERESEREYCRADEVWYHNRGRTGTQRRGADRGRASGRGRTPGAARAGRYSSGHARYSAEGPVHPPTSGFPPLLRKRSLPPGTPLPSAHLPLDTAACCRASRACSGCASCARGGGDAVQQPTRAPGAGPLRWLPPCGWCPAAELVKPHAASVPTAERAAASRAQRLRREPPARQVVRAAPCRVRLSFLRFVASLSHFLSARASTPQE